VSIPLVRGHFSVAVVTQLIDFHSFWEVILSIVGKSA
jgi:hypothetical protein